jgi:2-oxoglutarate ferredoxin oxidoreductase subunit gamma
MKRTEIRFAGFGGQGVVLIGVVLGHAAALHDGLFAVQTQSYGAEARGGAARSDVIISSEPVDSPLVTAPDYLVALCQEALDANIGVLRATGVLLTEADLVRSLPPEWRGKTCGFQALEAASAMFGKPLAANMIMLGAFVEVSQLVSARALETAVTEVVPETFVEMNLKAVRRGFELARTKLCHVG